MGISVSAESLSVETIVGAILGAILVLVVVRAVTSNGWAGRRRGHSRR